MTSYPEVSLSVLNYWLYVGPGSDNAFPAQFAEDALHFSMGDIDELFIIGGILSGGIGNVTDVPGFAVPEVFHHKENLFSRLGIAFGQLLLLPLFHHQDDISIIHHFPGEGIRSMSFEAETINARYVFYDRVGGAATAGPDAGRKAGRPG